MEDINDKILQGLSDKQKAAVTHPLKPLLIVAGPGSGKTRVMSHRIPWLVNNFHVKPYEILAVTFTNKAAKELMDRTSFFLQNTSNAIVKTFHGFASYFLRIEGDFDGLDRAFSIYDDSDQLRVIKNIFEELDQGGLDSFDEIQFKVFWYETFITSMKEVQERFETKL